MHDHLVDIDTGDILDFHDAAMDEIEERVAAKLGYRIVRRRVELYAVRIEPRPSLPLTGAGGKDEAT